MGYYGYKKIAVAKCPCGKHTIEVYECHYEVHSDYNYKEDDPRIAYRNTCDKYKFHTFGCFTSSMTINISYDLYKNDLDKLKCMEKLKKVIQSNEQELNYYKRQQYENIVQHLDTAILNKSYQYIPNYTDLLVQLYSGLYLDNKVVKYNKVDVECILSILQHYSSINKLKTSLNTAEGIKIFKSEIDKYKISNIKLFCTIFSHILFNTRYTTNSIKLIRIILGQYLSIFDDFSKVSNIIDSQLKSYQDEYENLYTDYYDKLDEFNDYLEKNSKLINYVKFTDEQSILLDNDKDSGYRSDMVYNSENDLHKFKSELDLIN